jgi:hypothetical protein
MPYNENDEYELESESSEDIYLEDTEEFRTTAYQAEEISRTKFNIVICQLYNSKRHGTPDANSGVEYHFITEDRFKLFDIGFIDYFIYGYHNMNLERIDEITPHDIFRNYKNIIQRPDYIKPEIAECLYLSGGECVSILKTFWIKIIQRRWKNILEEREHIIKLRCQVRSILHREINGKWPQYCLEYPGLKGMLA